MLSNFLEIFLLISPVFILIILGNLLRRIGVPELSFWHASDKLIYWVLIPALLFHHVSQITLSSIMIANYAVVILSGLFVVTTLSFIAGKLFGYTPQIWTSLMQGAARHNAFIALAIAGSLFGNKGLALGAIFMVILIPIINIVINVNIIHIINTMNCLLPITSITYCLLITYYLLPIAYWIPASGVLGLRVSASSLRLRSSSNGMQLGCVKVCCRLNSSRMSISVSWE